MIVAARLLDAFAVIRGRALVVPAGPAPLPANMLSAHFTVVEAGCRDGTSLPEPLYPNARGHAGELEVLRADVDRPIWVNSWWRSAAHNRRVGSTETSQHRLAVATDLVIAGMTPAEVATAIERLIAAGKMKQGGIGIYPGFCHYDSRGTRARWGR